MSLSSLLAKPLSPLQMRALVDDELARIRAAVNPMAVYLFGSAARGQMTDASDLDFLIIMADDADMRTAKNRYYAQAHAWPVDAVFVSHHDFVVRSEIGGICYICKKEGRMLFGQVP